MLAKGAKLGVLLSFMMGVTTLSLPSMIMLKKAIKPKLLGILLMARPTLSKVLYLQQIGRGLRKTDVITRTDYALGEFHLRRSEKLLF